MPATLSNLDALRKEIEGSGLDAVVAISPENVPYTSGAVVSVQRILRDRLAMVVLPREGNPAFLMAGQEVPSVKNKTWIEDLRGYVAHGASPIQSLVDVLEEKGLTAGRIGIELRYLSVAFHRELVQSMPEAEFVACEDLLQKVRMLKTPAEVDLITRAAVSTERALMATYATIKPGDREHGLVARLAGNMLQAGADMPAFLFLTVGPNTSYAHPDPTEYLVQTGDLVKADVGGYFSGYYSDIGRTGVVGKASAEQRSIYERLVEVHQMTIEVMKPGTPASEVYQTAVRGYQQVDIAFSLAFAGHAIGLGLHEVPLLSADEHMPLATDMVFCLETRVRWPGKEGYHIEDMIRITDEGPEILTTFMDTSRLLEL